jgi:UDP-N-acetylmuramoylalanine--D-glutamate ligase
MLKTTGRTVHLGGNIGVPLLPILDKIEENDLCVVELSSFQLVSMRTSPDVAVVTNISPNHLDVHGSMAEYVGAKLNILRHQGAFSRTVLSLDSEGAAAMKDTVRGRLEWFSRKYPVENGSWMDENGDILHSINGRAVRLFNRRDVRLRGLHNIENLLAATAAVWGTASPRGIAEVAKNFGGVEHRIEFVRKRNGVQWYNDSIATSPSRTIAGLRSFDEKLIVIAGGYDKQIPFEPLAQPLIERAKAVILTGPTAEKIEAVLVSHPDFAKSGLAIHHAKDLADAVKKADALAAAGDIVTLSPACASFDAFKNFEERGKSYKKLVNAL